MTIAQIGRTVGGWAAALLLFVTAISLLWQTHSALGFLFGLAAAAVCMPPVRSLAKQKLGFQASEKSTYGAAIFLAFVALVINGTAEGDRQQLLKVSERNAEAVNNQQLIDHFNRNKSAVLLGIKAKLDAGQIREAMAEIERYKTHDPDLMNLRRSVEFADTVARAQEDLKRESRSPC